MIERGDYVFYTNDWQIIVLTSYGTMYAGK
jgi:hypothetical protein